MLEGAKQTQEALAGWAMLGDQQGNVHAAMLKSKHQTNAATRPLGQSVGEEHRSRRRRDGELDYDVSGRTESSPFKKRARENVDDEDDSDSQRRKRRRKHRKKESKSKKKKEKKATKGRKQKKHKSKRRKSEHRHRHGDQSSDESSSDDSNVVRSAISGKRIRYV